ncbi:uncharacterized protein LOC143595713 [Bidens hawaiensis]|uniref:uncharacterized protein LOC143595713 n=1 Tax=Bidens hawaiensis TaxID=980011 RepID=UPI004049FA6B
MIVCSATTSASGVLCFLSTLILTIIMFPIRPDLPTYRSDYKGSVVVILITQFIGVILGTVAPLSRCFASLSFNVSIKWIWNHIGVFKVESYCTQKLYDWKQSSIPFKFSSRRCKCFFHDLKILTLNLCIKTQKTIVIACKMIALIPIFFVIVVLCCVHCWNWIKVMFGASNSGMVERPVQIQHNRTDLSPYVLQLQDDMEIAERTLKSISKSVKYVIQKAEMHKPNNLMKLLEKSSGFEGVGQYDVHQVPPLTKEKYVDGWSLPVVTLTTIIISLPNIQKDNIDKLLRSVSQGLTYVTHVEETLNASEEYAIIQKVARTLWLEVEVYHKWLGNRVQNLAHDVNTPKEIVQWLSDTAENIVNESLKGSDDSSFHKTISASSMYRITQTMLVSHHVDIDQVSNEELFGQLSSMISCILAACLTNLPQVITTKCHTSVIEKREASVHTAAQLLGETMQIINSLQDRNLPSLNHDHLPFIDKWRDFYLHPSP